MKRLDSITPEGTKDLLFEQYEQVKQAEQKLIEIYQKNGYHGVSTPAVEFFDVFSNGVGALPQQQLYTLTDNKGRIMVLRPDSTKPVARLVSTRLKDYPLPLRLYYNQCVYRRNNNINLLSDQIRQTGIELIGCPEKEGDIEVLIIAAECLQKTCGKNFMLEIGHMNIYKNIIDGCNICEEDREECRRLIERKSYSALSRLLQKYSKDDNIKALLNIPALYGGIEVLEKARAIMGCGLNDTLLYINSIYDELCKRGFVNNIAIDLGLVNGYGYYTGLVFKGYAQDRGEAVLSGGRYDTLYSDYNLDYAAIGFAINTEMLTGKREEREEENGKKPLTLALTKGRLEQEALKLLENAGFDCSPVKNKGRKLIAELDGLNIVFAKAADVITYTERGACDMGIVGKDTINEQGSSFYEMLDLGFGKCRFVLAAKSAEDFFKGYGIKKIATKYPAVASAYFSGKNIDVDIIKIDGSVELAPLLKLADGIVDITETGTTLKENGLQIVEEISEISARLIVNVASLKIKRKKIESFIELLRKAMK